MREQATHADSAGLRLARPWAVHTAQQNYKTLGFRTPSKVSCVSFPHPISLYSAFLQSPSISLKFAPSPCTCNLPQYLCAIERANEAHDSVLVTIAHIAALVMLRKCTTLVAASTEVVRSSVRLS